jgi:ArsR family transcriptional regulator
VNILNEKYNEYAMLFKALSDPNRLLIIDYLLESERCACKILDQLQISQSTLSYHMKILCESAIVNAQKEGKWMHYSLNKSRLEELNEVLTVFIKEDSSSTLKCLC